MSRNVLYLTPYPPTRSGIADYACAYRSAVEARTDWRFSLAELGERVTGSKPQDWMLIRRRVKAWKREGRLREVALVHGEIGLKQHDEFWTLFWLRRLFPELRCCITVHDPPLVVAPALYPLALGISSMWLRRALRTLDYTPLGRGVVRSVVARADGVFALSQAGVESLRGRVRDGVHMRRLPFLAYGGGARARAERSPDRPMRVLFFGFWAPGKGLEVLLEAAGQALSRRPGGLHLILAGGVDETASNRSYVESVGERIRRAGRQSVEVTGFVPGERLDELFSGADVLALPSTRTPCLSTSSVLFRAMAAGLAVVASDVGALREEVRHLETGLLVPPADAGALADALLLLAGDPALSARLGREAQAHLAAEHNEARIAETAADMYQAVARP